MRPVKQGKAAEERAFVAFGANLESPVGPPRKTFTEALKALQLRGIRIVAQSALYQTPCFPAGAGPDFVNAVIEVAPEVSPEKLLEILHAVENSLGRERVSRWAGRTCDLDVLAYGARILPNGPQFEYWRDLPPERQVVDAPDRLILPHPRLQDRAFALIPLADIAPDWLHPVSGLTVTQMLSHLSEDEKRGVKPL